MEGDSSSQLPIYTISNSPTILSIAGDKFDDVSLNDGEVVFEAYRDYGYAKSYELYLGKQAPSPCAAKARAMANIEYSKCGIPLVYDI